MTPSSNFADLITRARTDATLRGRIIYFPDQVVDEFGLAGPEAEAVLKGDVSDLTIDDDQLRVDAELVFDLHDLHSGE